MKKRFEKILSWMCILSLAAVMYGCEDPHTAHMEDFQRLIYFRNGGVQTLAITRIDAQMVMSIPVCKSGRNLEATGTALIGVMDQTQLDIYNMRYGTDYKLLPETCFTLSSNELIFGSSDSYRTVDLTIDTEKAFAEYESIVADGMTPVIPLQLYSNSKLSEGLNYLILTPEPQRAYITFSEPLVEQQYTSVMPAMQSYESSLRLNIDNDWDFTCDLVLQDDVESVLAAVNEQYGDEELGIEYSLLPEGAYSFEKTVSFTKGADMAPFKINIDRYFRNHLPNPADEKVPYYVLPLQIANITKEGLELKGSDSQLLLLVSHEMKFVGLKNIPLTADMLTVPGTEESEGSIAELVDGNENTYWHSVWSKTMDGDPDFGAYIEITLPEPQRYFQFSYCTRHNNDNGVPRKVAVGGSNDGEEWTVLKTDIECTATGMAEWMTLPLTVGEETYKYVRFGIIASASGSLTGKLGSSFTALAELTLQASVAEPTYKAVYDPEDEL